MVNKGGKLDTMTVLFGMSFVTLVGAMVIYLRKEDNDFAKFKNGVEALQGELKSANKKLDEIREENKSLKFDVEAAHGQADAAKSKAEVAEALAHKVAIDVARRPVQSVQAQTPIKVEPMRVNVVIYDKRDLKKATNKVKPTVEQKVIKSVKEKMRSLNN